MRYSMKLSEQLSGKGSLLWVISRLTSKNTMSAEDNCYMTCLFTIEKRLQCNMFNMCACANTDIIHYDKLYLKVTCMYMFTHSRTLYKCPWAHSIPFTVYELHSLTVDCKKTIVYNMASEVLATQNQKNTFTVFLLIILLCPGFREV